jgi:hypothetical protein
MAYSSSVRAYASAVTYNNVAAGFKFNGGSLIETTSAGWYTLATGSGTITSIEHTYASTYRGGINAIEVDGKILVDSGVTLPNVPSIASTVRANPSAGFSIITYTGNLTSNGSASVAHGLNATPELIITKQTDDASRWAVQHKDLADNHIVKLNETDATASFAYGDLTTRTSSIFSTNYTAGMNTNGDDFLALCFAPVEGYSAFGSYTGNGSDDGPFVYTGFKPRFLLLKRTDSSSSWRLFDTERETHNVQDALLFPNESSAETESSNYYTDILSNGFKLRTSNTHLNASGGTYVIAAFAEHPFKTARAR